MLVYGVAFDFFNISGSLYVDKTTDPSIRSSAQGLFVLMTNGIGATVGSLVAQAVVNYNTDATGGVDWNPVWATFSVYALVVGITFAIVFRPQKI
jgi:NHS family nucleoside permease-like MFS transporter